MFMRGKNGRTSDCQITNKIPSAYFKNALWSQ